MFGAATYYREKKFTHYHYRAVSAAKGDIRSILEKRRSVPYDELWAAAMQYSTVLESDLREWLSEWRDAHLVSITNMTARQKVPRSGRSQNIIWHS